MNMDERRKDGECRKIKIKWHRREGRGNPSTLEKRQVYMGE